MAQVKNGKYHGRIGNVVHRVVRGQQIVQSVQRNRKQSGDVVIENSLFGACSKMNASIYRLIRDFALRHLDYSFSWETMALLKRNFFQRRNQDNLPKSINWSKIEETDNLPINKNVRIEDVLLQLPLVDITDQSICVLIPEQSKITIETFMKGVVSLEYSISVIHYDVDLGLAEVAHEVNSGRTYVSAGFSEKLYEFPLVDEGKEIKDGLIILCFGLRFFESSLSYGYMNSQEVNPTAILGMWYKEGENTFDDSFVKL